MTKKPERLNFGEKPDTEEKREAKGSFGGVGGKPDGSEKCLGDSEEISNMRERPIGDDSDFEHAGDTVDGVRVPDEEGGGATSGTDGAFDGVDIPSPDYMQGYRDAIDDLCDARCSAEAEAYEEYCREHDADTSRDDEGGDDGGHLWDDEDADGGPMSKDEDISSRNSHLEEPADEPDSADALPNSEIGRRGETAACRLLKHKGYVILDRNWTCPAGEADIVALDDDCIVFVEVKTRTNIEYGLPEEAITPRKRARYEKIAAYYLAAHEGADARVRFDAVSLLVVPNHRALARHVINAFGSGM